MRAQELLHNLFASTCEIDKRIKTSLFSAAEALIRCRVLSINALGRALSSSAYVKHCIKRMDRLFGNKILHEEINIFYKNMSHCYLKNTTRPIIIVDGSGLTPCGTYHFLRAAIPVNGRSLTLYDEIHSINTLNKEKTHLNFLRCLKELIPPDCKPIIITDAGFRNTWFRKIIALGWDYIGRIRHQTQYCEEKQETWRPAKNLYARAKLKAVSLGRVVLAKTNPLSCYLYLIKQKKKYRIRCNLTGKKIQCSASLKHAKRGNEPWLLASLIADTDLRAEEIISLYQKRMQIEESFRDLKNTRNGLGLRHCRSYTPARLSVALLIANLSILALWLFGLTARCKNLHYSFQANTEKNRNVLSNIIIGWQVLLRPEIKFNKKELMATLTGAKWGLFYENLWGFARVRRQVCLRHT
jgi:hypothetical protein